MGRNFDIDGRADKTVSRNQNLYCAIMYSTVNGCISAALRFEEK